MPKSYIHTSFGCFFLIAASGGQNFWRHRIFPSTYLTSEFASHLTPARMGPNYSMSSRQVMDLNRSLSEVDTSYWQSDLFCCSTSGVYSANDIVSFKSTLCSFLITKEMLGSVLSDPSISYLESLLLCRILWMMVKWTILKCLFYISSTIWVHSYKVKHKAYVVGAIHVQIQDVPMGWGGGGRTSRARIAKFLTTGVYWAHSVKALWF